MRFIVLLLISLAVCGIDETAAMSTVASTMAETAYHNRDDNSDSNSTNINSNSTDVVMNSTISSYLRRPKNSLSTSAYHNKTACDVINSHDLPEECSCRQPGRYGVVVECLKVFNSTYLNDTIGMKINIDPCNPLGSRISLDITELDHNIDYSIVGIRAGEEKNFPIPGCSVIVPMVGHLGLDAAVLVYGNPDQLTLKVGLNACAVIRDKELCASSVPGLYTILPWYVLSGTYSFGDVCNNSTNITTAVQ